ncbi:MAG TPA: GNAT family N-acetyltransferase [bacterium]|nr:GNAT family N-acetyltransferase [bacterium]
MTTASISIRFARKGDAEGFVVSWNESFRKGHLGYTGTRLRSRKDIERFRKRYSERKRNEIVFVAVAEKNRIIGNCGFFARERGRTRHRGELGWMVHHDYVGRGIATKLLGAVLKEAKNRGYKRVEAEIAVENVASIRLATRYGFQLEGRRKAGIVLDTGRYLDTYIFGRILK